MVSPQILLILALRCRKILLSLAGFGFQQLQVVVVVGPGVLAV